MTVYKFTKTISLKTKKDIDSEILADIVDQAEDAAYKTLLNEVSRRYIGFIVDSEITTFTTNGRQTLKIELTIDMDISPLIEKVAEQDRIAEEIANAFFGVVEKEIRKLLEKTDRQ